MKLEDNVTICEHCKVATCGGDIFINEGTVLGDYTTITAQGCHAALISIGDGSWIGIGVILLAGAVIGKILLVLWQKTKFLIIV